MKKFLVPSLLALLVAGLGQRESSAGSFSIGISIGDSHRHSRPPVVVAPPVVYTQPAVCAPVVVARPQVVYAPVRSPYYVRECEHRHGHYRHGHGYRHQHGPGWR